MRFEDYRYNTVDRIRGVKKTTSQNTKRIASEPTHNGRSLRKNEDPQSPTSLLFQKLELQFRGERKDYLKQPESMPEGLVETTLQEQLPNFAKSLSCS
jgi:hypothetical protein